MSDATPDVPRTVIFDLDGTLVDSGRDLLDAVNARFADLGHDAPLTLARDHGLAFRGGRAMLTEGSTRLGLGWTPDDVMREYLPFIEIYKETIADHTVLYEGAREVLEGFKSEGVKLGLCTNKPEDLTHILLERLDIARYFDAVIGAKTVGVSKPDPAPYLACVERAGGDVARSLLIGDTITDRDTARAAGVPIVLVTFGPARDEMAALTPDALLARFDDLPKLVSELLP